MDISEAPPTFQVLCYVRRWQWEPRPFSAVLCRQPVPPLHLQRTCSGPVYPDFPFEGGGGLWITSAWCGSIGNYVLKHWNFWDVSMVYGTIIFEVGTWEPSSTPPSSLSPGSPGAPHRRWGRGGTDCQAGAVAQLHPVNMNPVLQHLRGSRQCFVFLTAPRVTGLLCKKKKKNQGTGQSCQCSFLNVFPVPIPKALPCTRQGTSHRDP